MTEDRARPLVAFALVSLLCAVILSINLAQSRHPGVIADHLVRASSATSAVVFGNTLTPRATQAASSLSASLAGVGPLSSAVARADTSAPSKTSTRTARNARVVVRRLAPTAKTHPVRSGSRSGHAKPAGHAAQPGSFGPARHGHARPPGHSARNGWSHYAVRVNHGPRWGHHGHHGRHHR